MNRINRIVAGITALTIAAAALPALAQSEDYSIAKVVKQGTTSHPVAGSGTVQVQVQVNADGTHKAIKVLRSSNPGDNAAAMEIAQNSTYRPARRGSTPITTFYDFNLHFNGKSAAADMGSGGGDTAAIDALVRAGKYKDAIAKANAALLSSPGDPGVLQLLGVAQYYDNDFTDAAATFSRVQDIKKPFQPIAAQAFATGAVHASQSNPAQALDYANKAVTLSKGDATSKFALGVAQLANKQNDAALATLKGVHDQVVADPEGRRKDEAQRRSRAAPGVSGQQRFSWGKCHGHRDETARPERQRSFPRALKPLPPARQRRAERRRLRNRRQELRSGGLRVNRPGCRHGEHTCGVCSDA